MKPMIPPPSRRGGLLHLALFSIPCLVGWAADAPETTSPEPAVSSFEPTPDWARASRYFDLFTPATVEKAAISPDGQKFAFGYFKEGVLAVCVFALEPEFQKLSEVIAWAGPDYERTDENGGPPAGNSRARSRPAFTYLRWATNDRLIIGSNQAVETGGRHAADGGAVFAINADGSEVIKLADPEILQRTELGFDGYFNHEMYRRLPEYDSGRFETRRYERPYYHDHLRTPEQMHDLYGHFPYHHDPDFHHYNHYNHYNSWAGGPGFSAPSTTYINMAPVEPLTLSEDGREVIVRAGPETLYDVYAIDVFTGAKRQLQDEKVSNGKAVLLDRSFEANISIPYTTRASFPHEYQYDPPRFFSLWRWKTLSDYVDVGPDGTKWDFTVSPENVAGNRAIPLGFSSNNEELYFASDQEFGRFVVRSANLKTGELSDLLLEDPNYDLIPWSMHTFRAAENLVYDPYDGSMQGIRYDGEFRTARWIDSERQAIQDRLEEQFLHRGVELIDWTPDAGRYLVSVRGPTDPGGIYLYTPEKDQIHYLVPHKFADRQNDVWSASFTLEDEARTPIQVRLTFPHERIASPTPLVVFLPENIWDRLPADFDSRAMALARMGYVVARFSGPGAWGYGSAQRTALSDGGVQAYSDSVLRVVAAVAERFEIDQRRVGLIGEGVGGYLALRTLQDFPEWFRCGVVLNAPLDPVTWMEEIRWANSNSPRRRFGFGEGFLDASFGSDYIFADGINLRDRATASDLQLMLPYLSSEEGEVASILETAETLTRPVQLFVPEIRREGSADANFRRARNLVAKLQDADVPAELRQLHDSFWQGQPFSQAVVYANLAGFLNTHMFDYEVEFGDPEYQYEVGAADAE